MEIQQKNPKNSFCNLLCISISIRKHQTSLDFLDDVNDLPISTLSLNEEETKNQKQTQSDHSSS